MCSLGLLLAGCAENSGPEDDRKFANDAVTEAPVEPTKPPIVPDGVIPTEAVPTALPPNAADALVSVETTPPGVMFRDGNSIVIVDPLHPESPGKVSFTQDWNLLDFAPSPSGGRVVGLLRGPASELKAELRNTRGELLGEWDLVAWLPSEATPTAGTSQEAGFAVSWTGENERVLVTIAGSTLVSISLEGGPTEIKLPASVHNLVEASWSPTGDRIAMLGVGADGSGVVWTVSPYVDGESFRQVIPPPADAANLGSVTQFAWLPNGSGLLYILAQDASATNPGGNLYRLDLASRQRQVVATPGRGGPTAQIVDFAVAPDGSAVSYVIASATSDEWAYHSLWIRSLSSVLHLQIDTGGASNVSGMEWVNAGFVWRATVHDAPELVYQDQRTPPTVIWSVTTSLQATPVAGTPVASPVASPVTASPVASPIASPDASPGSTPVS